MIHQAINGINQMPLHKTRGVDGFPTEFFRCFGTELAPLLAQMYAECRTKGRKTRGRVEHLSSDLGTFVIGYVP